MQSGNDWHHLQLKLDCGRNLGYAECGEKHGTPLIYFHGGLSSRLDIAFASGICKQKGIRLIAPDRPGIGLSEHQHTRGLLDWPLDVQMLADRLELRKFATLGWSLGGPYSLVCGFSLPDRVTVAGTVGCIAPLPWSENLSALGLMADRLLIWCTRSAPFLVPPILTLSKWLPAKYVKDALLQELVRSPGDRKVIESLSVEDATDFFREALRTGVAGTAEDYRTISFDWPFAVDQIQAPVRLWHGKEDIIVPLSHAKYLEAHIPDAELTIVPGQGHFLLHNHFADVVDVLMALHAKRSG